MVSLTSVQQGDKVEYRPIGGAEENVAHSTGTIENVGQAEDGVSLLGLIVPCVRIHANCPTVSSLHHQERQHGQEHELPGWWRLHVV